jgi:CRP-like cAMP-binding protein
MVAGLGSGIDWTAVARGQPLLAAMLASLRVVADGRLLKFAIAEFRAALENDASLRRASMAHLAGEVRKLRAQCERLSLNSAAERILHYLDSEGSNRVVMLRQSRKSWAAELGLTHEALYRTL